MTPRQPDPDAATRPHEVDRLLERFEQAWQGGPVPRIEDFVPADWSQSARHQVLEELIKIDLDHHWRQAGSGHSPKVEDYLKRWPELARSSPVVLELIRAEYWARCCWRQSPNHAEYATRFPQQKAHLAKVLGAVDAELAAELAPKRQPAPAARARPPQPKGPAPPSTVAGLLDLLQRCQLLNRAQFEEISRRAPGIPGTVALAKELLQRDWLTPYQANQLIGGNVNDLVLGSYVLLERLGSGGMGQVFKARHRGMNRVVALKVIRREVLSDAEGVGRFEREMQLVSQLDHPNVVRGYDAGPAGDTLFLAMEFIEGSDLGKLVKQGGPLPVMQACEYIRQAALGLAHVHERGLVHRDIKPHNLIVSLREGLVKLADLGLARLPRGYQGELTAALTSGGTGTGTLTPQNAVLMGTADFLAPEQAMDFHNADIRADIYSLGCTFHYLLTGQPPFADGNLAQKVARHLQAEPPRIEQLRPDVPPALAETLRKMMAKRPEDRYQTPAEVAQQLQALVTSRPARSVRSSQALLLGPGPGRRRAWLLAVAACVLGAALAFLRFGPGRTSPSPAGLARAEVLDLQRRSADPKSDADALRRDLVRLRMRFPGTAEALQAADLLRKLPCSLDSLASKNIPESERFWHQPKELVAVLGEHRWCPWKWIRCAAVTSDGKLLAVAGDDGLVRIWDMKAKKLQLIFLAHRTEICSLVFSPGNGALLASGSMDGAVKLWDVSKGECKQTLTAHAGGVRAVAFAPDGLKLASGGHDETVKLWAIDPNGKVLNPQPIQLPGHKGVVNALAFHPDPKRKLLASAGEDRLVKLWDGDAGKPIADLSGHSGVVYALTFAAGGESLVSGSETANQRGELKFWNVKSLSASTKETKTAVRLLALAPDGKTVAVPSSNPAADSHLRFFDVATQKEIEDASVSRPPLATALAYLPPDGQTIALFEASRLGIYHLATKRVSILTDEREIERVAVAISPDCKTVATGGGTPLFSDVKPTAELKLWDVATQQELHAFKGHDFQVQDLAFAPDGSALAAADIDGNVIVWDLATRKQRCALKLYSAGGERRGHSIRLAYSPDGKLLATAEYRGPERAGPLKCWDPDTGTERHSFPGHARGTKSLSFSPDGNTLASGGSLYDKTVKLWDLAGRKELSTLPQTPTAVSDLAFRPDGRALVYGHPGQAQTFRSANPPSPMVLWDLARQKESGRFPTAAQAIVFLHGRVLTSLSTNGSLTAWDEASSRRIDELALFGPVKAADLANNGRHLAVANANGTVYILDLKDFASKK